MFYSRVLVKHPLARMEEGVERFTRQTVTAAPAQEDSLAKTVTEVSDIGQVSIILLYPIARESCNVYTLTLYFNHITSKVFPTP